MKNAIRPEGFTLAVQLDLRHIAVLHGDDDVKSEENDGDDALENETDFVVDDRARVRADVAHGVEQRQNAVEEKRAAVPRSEGQGEEDGLRAARCLLVEEEERAVEHAHFGRHEEQSGQEKKVDGEVRGLRQEDEPVHRRDGEELDDQDGVATAHELKGRETVRISVTRVVQSCYKKRAEEEARRGSRTVRQIQHEGGGRSDRLQHTQLREENTLRVLEDAPEQHLHPREEQGLGHAVDLYA